MVLDLRLHIVPTPGGFEIPAGIVQAGRVPQILGITDGGAVGFVHLVEWRVGPETGLRN